MNRLERFTAEVQEMLPPLVAGQVFHLVETAAHSGVSRSAYGMVQMLPEIGQQALACVGLNALVDEITGGGRAPDTPLEVLQRQLVNDEITVEEFAAKRAELLAAGEIDPGEESRQRDEHDSRMKQFREKQRAQIEQFDARQQLEAA